MGRINKKKYFYFILLLTASCGTLGHIQFYRFDKPKAEVELDLLSVINKDSVYSPPLKWNDYELGSDSIYDIFILFKTAPKELYQVRFANKSSWNSSNICKLGLVGVFDGKLWHFEKDLDSKEEERLKKRFESEILSKMKFQYSREK